MKDFTKNNICIRIAALYPPHAAPRARPWLCLGGRGGVLWRVAVRADSLRLCLRVRTLPPQHGIEFTLTL